MDENQHVAGTAAEGADDGLLVVIGAGAAGLSAARAARAQGRTVVVLEASDRAGGRIWTDHSLGFPAELGANFIHGASDQNPLTRLAKKTGSCLQSACSCRSVFLPHVFLPLFISRCCVSCSQSF